MSTDILPACREFASWFAEVNAETSVETRASPECEARLHPGGQPLDIPCFLEY
jgi:hypothetical protein